MRILIIGGTRFVGRALVESALAHGHDLTLFNRGKTNPDLFPQVANITGDRDGGLDALGTQQTWDAVIDTVGYVPRVVRQSVDALRDRVGRYAFISTISVYDQDKLPADADENAPLSILDDPTVEQITGETYGGLKVLCEQTVSEVYGDRALLLRPGLIVGPHDPTNRFTYWVRRLAQGGDVLAPPDPEQPVQFIDARDLAEFTIHALEQAYSGDYNLTGPDYPLTLQQLFSTCLDVANSRADLHWAPAEFLEKHEVTPWSELPLYFPGQQAAKRFFSINVQKAIDAGLRFSPLPQTVRDTLDWLRNLPGDPPGDAGLSPEREKALLQALASE